MIAIIIPTKNRSEFILRALNFYKFYKFSYSIYIADSSDKSYHISENIKNIGKFTSSLKIIRVLCPDQNIELAKANALKVVSEKYAAYAGDDDFLIPETLIKCKDFLENNSDYNNCTGRGLTFNTLNNLMSGKIFGIYKYDFVENIHDDPMKRLEYYLDNYMPIFSLRRTKNYLSEMINLNQIPLEDMRETTMGCLGNINGKTKKIDELYIIRQFHNARFQNDNTERFPYAKGSKASLSIEAGVKLMSESLVCYYNKELSEISSFVSSLYVKNHKNRQEYRDKILRKKLKNKSLINKKSSIKKPIRNFLMMFFTDAYFIYIMQNKFGYSKKNYVDFKKFYYFFKKYIPL